MKQHQPLRRHPNLIPISREHHKILILAQLLKKDVPDYKGLPDTPEGKRKYFLQTFNTLLKNHIQKEEREIIPKISGIDKELDQIALEIRAEHQEIINWVLFFRQSESTPRENDLDQLGRLLEKHVRKEERHWFSRIQMVLNEEALEEVKW